MTATDELEGILDEAANSLALLQPDALEALETRLLAFVRTEGARGVQAPGVRRSLEMLGRCVAMTAGNLTVLERLAQREGVA